MIIAGILLTGVFIIGIVSWAKVFEPMVENLGWPTWYKWLVVIGIMLAMAFLADSANDSRSPTSESDKLYYEMYDGGYEDPYNMQNPY